MTDQTLFNTVKELRDKGNTWNKIANKINAMGYRTPKGKKWCDKLTSLILIKQDPSYRTYATKTKTRARTVTKNTTPNEVAIDLILSTKTLSIKDRLEIAMKLL